MSLVKIEWKPSPNRLRIFGISNLIILGLAGWLFYRKGMVITGEIFCGLAVASFVTGITGTKIALPIYWAFMAVGLVMGNIVGRIMIAVFYYCVLTPMGLVMRLTGRDKLQLKKREVESYWQDIPPHAEGDRYERQF